MDMQRQDSIDEIVASGASTSAKIRSLAVLGLLRTEIRDLLGIRYQHVRKVLIDAGIEDGKREPTSPQPVLVERPLPAPITDSAYPWRRLLDCGFEVSGNWVREATGIGFDGDIPRKPGVYVFVLADEIVYVGVTQKTLRQRMAQYKAGNPRQRTSHRVNREIAASLLNTGGIIILTATPDDLAWNNLPVRIAPGLEAALISEIKPRWNIQGAVTREPERRSVELGSCTGIEPVVTFCKLASSDASGEIAGKASCAG